MRCHACNEELTDYEATRKCAFTGTFLDLCTPCYKHIEKEIKTIDNPAMRHEESWHEDCSYKTIKDITNEQ